MPGMKPNPKLAEEAGSILVRLNVLLRQIAELQAEVLPFASREDHSKSELSALLGAIRHFTACRIADNVDPLGTPLSPVGITPLRGGPR
jgi:hypothetical protein